MKVCYFTATGNCLYVAERIGDELLSIPQLMKQDEIELEDEAVGIVCPVYAVEMPMMVREFMHKAKIKTDYFFFVYTYGEGYAEALAHAELVAQEVGLDLAYANAVQMVDNYLPGFEMGQQIDSLVRKDVEGQLERLWADIAARRESRVDVTPETLAAVETWQQRLAVPILRKDTARHYIVTDAYTRCGICAQVCPAGNIVVGDKVVFEDKCEVCYACLHACPQCALHIPRERSAARFRNEHISLKRIIEANA
ncbi:MAG: EFR1 family ferrodoxin [Eggerthellaceae bacterium]|nr:EFR1 family ferrodoxin [Eggerthellaceae bacterium]